MKLLRTIARYLLDSGLFALRADTDFELSQRLRTNSQLLLNTNNVLVLDGANATNRPVLYVKGNNGVGGVEITNYGNPSATRHIAGLSGGRWSDDITNGGGLRQSVLGNLGGGADRSAFDLTMDGNAATAFRSLLGFTTRGTAPVMIGYNADTGLELFRVSAAGHAAFAGVTVAGHAVWHADNFNPQTLRDEIENLRDEMFLMQFM